MKIYTKTGDAGETGLLSGKRVPKTNPFIEGLGAIDEAMAAMGLVHAALLEKNFNAETTAVEKIQKVLFYIGTIVAREGTMKKGWPEHLTLELEQSIDQWGGKLPELKNFVLPGGTTLTAYIHQARASVRKMERELIPLLQKSAPRHPALVYINRLSDYLFQLSRWAAFKQKSPEILLHPDHVEDL